MSEPAKSKARGAIALPEDAGDAKDGPAMLALGERQREFVRGLFVFSGHGSRVKAARAAGFGTKTSSPQSMATIASRLAHDDKVLAAVREYAERRILATSPAAVRALENLINDSTHRDHMRAVAASLDRNHPVATSHIVKVEHDATPALKKTAEVMERITALAAKVGIDIRRVPQTIEHVGETK